jgi:hypothetical protein
MATVSASLQVLAQGDVTRTSDLDVLVRGDVNRTVALDMAIEREPPYRYEKIYGDILTRYFGGSPSVTFGAPVITQLIGQFNLDYTGSIVYQFPNTIPTGPTFDKYSLPFAPPLSMNVAGRRLLINMALRQLGPNSSLVLGLFADQLSPTVNVGAGTLVAFEISAEQDHVAFRGYYGAAVTTPAKLTGIALSSLLHRLLVIEIEAIATDTVAFRLFAADRNLDIPLYETTLVDVTIPVVDRVSFTSLGKANVSYPSNTLDTVVDLYSVDFEAGVGSVYTINPGVGLPMAEAKWRLWQDRTPFQLRNVPGSNTVTSELSPDLIVSTTPKSVIVEVNVDDPIITVDNFLPDSNVLVPGSVSPPIVKGSRQPAFDTVRLYWQCTHAGTFSIRVNSTGMTDGIEIASGAYPTAGLTVQTNWSFSDLPDVDGTYDVTLYVLADTGRPAAKKLGIYLLP